MRDKENKSDKKKTSTKKKTEESRSREYETMSQQQNRYGNGRQHNGSDGSPNGGRGSNH